jgi:hypothetical protein
MRTRACLAIRFIHAQRPAQLLRYIKVPLTLNMCVAVGVVVDYEVCA